MGLIKWSNEVIKKLNFWDIAALKLYCAIFGIIIGAYISSLVKQRILFFISLFVILGVRLTYKVFEK